MQRSIAFALDYIFYLKKYSEICILESLLQDRMKNCDFTTEVFSRFKLKNVVKPALNDNISSVDFLVHETTLFL